MKTRQPKYKELHIRVEPENTEQFLEALERDLPADWHRDLESENRSPNLTGRLFAYFRCDETTKRRSAVLAMYRKGRNMIYVSNVVPVGVTTELSVSEYNGILMGFHDQILRTLAIPITLTIIVVEAK